MTTSTGRGKGFASMTSEQRRRIASLGGKAAHEQGVAHRWVEGSEEPRAAGRNVALAPSELIIPRKRG